MTSSDTGGTPRKRVWVLQRGLLFLAREMLGFATSNLKIQRKVKKHEWLNLSRLIETAMFSRNIKGLFPYYQFEMDVNSSPSNPREEA